MENTAQHAIERLRNRMTGDDLLQLSDTDLHRLEAICQHWQAMANTEHHRRQSATGKSRLEAARTATNP